MKVFFIILFCLFCSTVISQNCERPNHVYVGIPLIKEDLVDKKIYCDLDSGESFERISEIQNVSESEFKKFKIHTPSELRELEIEIRKCEIKNASENVFLDVDINKIFESIFIIYKVDGKICKFRVNWIDSIE